MASSNTVQRHIRNGRKVAPEEQIATDRNLIELRPNRILHVKHLNARRKNKKFESELHGHDGSTESQAPQALGVSLGNLPLSHTRPRSNTQANGQPEHIKNKEGACTKSDVIDDLELDIRNGREAELGEHKDTQLAGEKDTHIQGWVTNTEVGKQRTKEKIITPAHTSESVSNIDVLVPGSILPPNSDEAILHESQTVETQSTTIRQRKKSKDYRPFSAKSLSQTVKSVISSNGNYDIESDCEVLEAVRSSHLSSPYKDATLFFIHGVAGSADVWNAQLEFFAGLGFEVIAPDLIGHGLSHGPKKASAYHFNEILKDMEALFDKFCNRQNIVIGHSYGCAFASVLGRRRARRVTKLVLISGGAPVPLAPQLGIFQLPVCCLSCIKPCLLGRLARGAFYTKDSGAAHTPCFDVPMYVLRYIMSGQVWPDGDDLYHRWLSMPTLLLHGKHDKFVSVDEECEMEKSIYYSELHVVDDASHMLMMEAPRQVNDLLYNFVIQQPPSMSSTVHNSTFAR